MSQKVAATPKGKNFGGGSDQEIIHRIRKVWNDSITDPFLPRGLSPQVKKSLLEAGFIFTKEQVGPYCVKVILPKGWRFYLDGNKTKASIYDGNNNLRLSIVHRASFSDVAVSLTINRRFFISLTRRERDTDHYSFDVYIEVKIMDSARKCGFVEVGVRNVYGDNLNAACSELIAELEKEFPDWRDPMAYWPETEVVER